MPSPEQILSGLSDIANDWRWLATFWHVYFGVCLAGLAGGLRPSRRIAALLLLPPLLCVSLLAWLHANPFNGGLFALFGVVLIVVASRLPDDAVVFASGTPLVAGLLAAGFGWGYPHFLEGATLIDYLIAAPVGLVPCPTISILIGLTFLMGGFGSRAWCLALAFPGVFYGIFGAVRLGVTLDWVLVFGALALAVYGVFRRRPERESGGRAA